MLAAKLKRKNRAVTALRNIDGRFEVAWARLIIEDAVGQTRRPMTAVGSRGKIAPCSGVLKKRTLVANQAIQRVVVQQYVEKVVDLIGPEANQIYNLTIEEAKRLLLGQ